MTFWERINGGVPMQAGDFAVIGTHVSIWLSMAFFGLSRIVGHDK